MNIEPMVLPTKTYVFTMQNLLFCCAFR